MRRTLRATAAALLLMAACAPASSGQRGISVVATTTVIADLARSVAGDAVNVESIAPAGASVEDFEPKPEDARRIANASVVLVNGLSLDRWAEPLVRNASRDAHVITLSDGLPRLGIGESNDPDISKKGNPHYWFDVAYAKVYVEKIRDALIAADLADRDGYASRARSYLSELDDLDGEIRAQVGRLTPERRQLVTSHDAFPYFARAYGFTIVGFTQPEEGKEPAPAQLAQLVAAVRAANVPAIFSESQVSPRLAETLAREAGVKTVVSDLPTDSLEAAPADSYLGMMRVLVDKIVSALR